MGRWYDGVIHGSALVAASSSSAPLSFSRQLFMITSNFPDPKAAIYSLDLSLDHDSRPKLLVAEQATGAIHISQFWD